MARANAFYAQSGGVTSVINASACGVIETARKHKKQIGRVYAGKNGILGALKEELIDTSRETNKSIAALRHTPSGAFGSCRYKLKAPEADDREYARILEVFRSHNIRYFFYNGGGDSQDTVDKLASYSKRNDYDLSCIGIPKTVDNDLPYTDCCPGFGSVAKYVAIATREASLDVASMCETSTKVFVLEVMGRHAGWIAASGALAQEKIGDSPQIILFPEVPFVDADFLRTVKRAVNSKGYCVIVVSEGVRRKNGRFLSESGSKDAFGHVQLGGVAPVIADMIGRKLGYKNHWAVADYLQRAARHIASATDVEQAYSLGKAAVELAISGHSGVMPIIKRVSDSPYRWKIGYEKLSKVANVERFLPKSFISQDGYGITAKARRYLEPLIAGEDYPPFRGGMPQYVRLKNLLVEKKCPVKW